MEPIIAGQVEVTGGGQFDRACTQFASDVDAATQIFQDELAVFVDHSPLDFNILRGLGQVQVFERGVPRGRVGLLCDADDAVAGWAWIGQRGGIEIRGTGAHHHPLLVHQFGCTGLVDADVVDLQTKRCLVDHSDVGFAMGDHALGGDRTLHRGLGGQISLDRNQSGRGLDAGHAQVQHVETLAS